MIKPELTSSYEEYRELDSTACDSKPQNISDFRKKDK
jgi:hypothetical protein